MRCLRQSDRLSQNHAPEQWAGRLSRDWLQASGEWAGTLYVDGHVRLYHGDQTPLPRRYVARQKLCLRAPPATGSTTRWASPSSWSTVPSTRGRRWKATSCRGCSNSSPPIPPSLRHGLRPRRLQPEFFKQMSSIACLRIPKVPGRNCRDDAALGRRCRSELAPGSGSSGLFVEVRLTESGHQKAHRLGHLYRTPPDSSADGPAVGLLTYGGWPESSKRHDPPATRRGPRPR